MKLVTKLAKKFSVWPCSDCASIYSTDSGMIWDTEGETHGQTLYEGEFEYESVTRAQWEAERARIAMEEFTELDQKLGLVDEAHIADLTAIACGKRSKEDQELWDKVAVASTQAFITAHITHFGHENAWQDNELVSCAADYADAFMAERAKRMKG